MGRNQHHARLHFERYDPHAETETAQEKKKKNPMRCVKCRSFSLSLDESGMKYVCKNCLEEQPVTKDTDLGGLALASSPKALKAAEKYQAKLRGMPMNSPRCPVCRSLLKKDRFCPQCQTYRLKR